MVDDADREVGELWDRVAADWRIQVGTDGDANRRLNSDPVLWAMLGDVRGHRVLDAGCGTGYLTRQLAERGALVTGVDLSGAMIAIARNDHPTLDFRVDSLSALRTLDDHEFDAIVSNYVLMDAPDLEGAMRAFARVLKPGGEVVVVFSHPCFPQGSATFSEDRGEVGYVWPFSYFEPQKRTDPPWGHFTSEFIWFHRPLSDYWKAFRSAGFSIADFEEPRVTAERAHMAESARRRSANRMRPYSVAFRLQKEP